MPRIVSVWLPGWPILRFLAAQARCSSSEPVDPERPFVLTVEAAGGPRIAAANPAARAEGLNAGDLVADARARVAALQARPAAPAADDAALRRLALWATRYTPAVALYDEASGADGLFLDITGAAHLFGGEAPLVADLAGRLAGFGLTAKLAIAETPGAAWALARFAPGRRIDAAETSAALAPLPIEALRLTGETRAMLRRLGFKRVGALAGAPRAPFAARFERELLKRLDQALGRAAEPLRPVVPPPVYHSLRYLMEPVTTQAGIVAVAKRLMQDLVHALTRDGVGARALRLALYRLDGETPGFEIPLTTPTRSVDHVARLIELKLDRIEEDVDAGFGFEALGLAVTRAEPITARQTDLAATAEEDGAERCAALIDRLTQRLGAQSVKRLAPRASHVPERAEAATRATAQAVAWPAPDQRPRPLVLLATPEPTEITALIPEGLPRRFRWRGLSHGVAWLQGPERIAAEWWREDRPTRDYFLVEDDQGRRFWLCREGIYGRETELPRWFVHGLFA
ncbi:MAG: DNA polymerase Y family protein [Xanthobacteraceae bacterium]|nr:DNA polymerase Y family protein [Xanthobacteraceae bacterium]